MRFFRRLYFDNTTAKDQYLAAFDKGVSGTGAPRFSVEIGEARTLDAIIDSFLAQCFFVLPIGSYGVLDVFIPDDDGSEEPKTFDFQVFRSSKTQTIDANAEKTAREALLQQISGPIQQYLQQANFRRIEAVADVVGRTCHYFEGSCGGQGSIDCEPPKRARDHVAKCVNNTLSCVPDGEA